MTGKTEIAIFGSKGRMGHALQEILKAHPRLSLGAAIDAGSDLSPINGCRVGVDFSVPEASAFHARLASKHDLPMVIGTTGLTAAHEAELHHAAKTVPIVYAANTSVGVTLLAVLVERASAALGPDWDIEIAEMHHRHKVDAPSGTALMLGRAAASGRHVNLEQVKCSGRDGTGAPRVNGEIGFAALRGGNIAGEHTVYFAGENERIELAHKATSRAVFASGALTAAEWVMGKPAGLYTMRDVLGV